MIFPEASSEMMALGNSFGKDVLIDGDALRRMKSPAKTGGACILLDCPNKMFGLLFMNSVCKEVREVRSYQSLVRCKEVVKRLSCEGVREG